MNESIQSKLAINIAQLSLEKATLEAQNENLQATVSQQNTTEQAQAERIQELEKEVADLKEQNERLLKELDAMPVEVVK